MFMLEPHDHDIGHPIYTGIDCKNVIWPQEPSAVHHYLNPFPRKWVPKNRVVTIAKANRISRCAIYFRFFYQSLLFKSLCLLKSVKFVCLSAPFHSSYSVSLQARTLKFWPFTNSRTVNRMVSLSWRSGALGSQYGGTDHRKIWHVIYRWNQDNFLSILSIHTCRT